MDQNNQLFTFNKEQYQHITVDFLLNLYNKVVCGIDAPYQYNNVNTIR